MKKTYSLDFDDVAGAGLVDEAEDEGVTALQRVAKRISGQYGEVIVSWSSSLFSSPAPASTWSIQQTVSNLLRLAKAAGDPVQIRLLNQLQTILNDLEGTRPTSRRGESGRVALRAWIPKFAKTLTGEDAERLRRLVQWKGDVTPLIEELRGIPGVGKQRLIRLYSAGLGELKTVSSASPEDIAAVTGIPLRLCVQIVARAKEYAEVERRRCVQDIQMRADRLANLLELMQSDDDELAEAAQSALAHVQQAFDMLRKREATHDAS